MACASKLGERQYCPADTSKGVALGEIQRGRPLPARQDVGLRRRGRLGVGRVQRGVRGRRRRWRRSSRRPSPERKPLDYIPNAGFLIVDSEKGEMYVRLFSYVRYLNQKGLDPDLHGLLRQHEDRAPAPGRPAEQVLPALLGLVPEPEVPLLPLRLVVERLPGRSRPGRGGGQPQLRRQPARDHRRRHHQPPRRAQHGGPVPLLAGGGRPPDLGRVLPAARTPAACGSRAS